MIAVRGTGGALTHVMSPGRRSWPGFGGTAARHPAWLWAADPDAAGPRAAGPKVAVTGPAAAHWHGMLARGPAVVDVTVPRRTKPRARPGLRVHRRDLSAADVVTLRGLRVAGKGLATLETAIALPDGAAFLDRALQRHVRFPELYGAYCRGFGRAHSVVAQIAAALARAA